MRFLAAAAVLSSLSAQPLIAQDQDVLKTLVPASNWVLDYAEDSCALRRAFGEEGSQVFLEMRQFAPNDSLQVIVSSDDIAYRRRQPSLQFLPDPAKAEKLDVMAIENDSWGEGFLLNTSVRTAPDGETMNAEYWAPDERDARESSITGISVKNAFREDFVLRTGSLAKPFNAMRECINELLSHWNLDPEVQRSLLRPVSPRNYEESARALIDQGYPYAMARKGEQTAMRIRMAVDASGKGTICKAQMQIGHPEFEKAACDLLMRRLEFNPALGRDGEPVASYWTISIVYRMN